MPGAGERDNARRHVASLSRESARREEGASESCKVDRNKDGGAIDRKLEAVKQKGVEL